MILKPMLIQSPTIATTMRATHSVVIHRGPSIPKKRKMTFTMPASLWKIMRHTIEIAVGIAMYGRKNRAR